MPIAWAFLGLDGALATLHVEPDRRGQGLASCLSMEIMRREMDLDGMFGAKGEDGKVQNQLREWVHADVAQYNMARRRAIEKVGVRHALDTGAISSYSSGSPRHPPSPIAPRHAGPVKPAIVAALVSTWNATFLAAADSTITSTLSATIAHEFESLAFESLAFVSWLGSGYLIGLTATQPLSRKLSDIFGRRVNFCIASGLFTIGNLVCGFSRSKVVLIAARTSGMSLGAVIGGAINDAVGWRWAFVGIAPLSFIAGLGVATFVPSQGEGKQKLGEMLGRIDFLGAVTLVSSLVLLLPGLNYDGSQERSPMIVMAIPAGAALMVAFLIEYRWAKEPIIPLSLFGRRTVVAACLTAWFMSMAFYALTFYVPLYLQMPGYSTSETGLQILPDSIGAGLVSFR
ncbi:Major facilitator superfamily domain general substrate transporter [Penicillium odoratum]|uniref:Major facilitator superfamily domain general substrate transporter n=1 Tax=Penicillium odoratum TaxID=1167516 RepID=UPI002546753E|nr:Major facilitator superfamily domain general substrate transporter [Penicillium odoratum]KAJ5745784.1 Major facilitator superfamily domain general substrate transporter [Penicillium odoratum]